MEKDKTGHRYVIWFLWKQGKKGSQILKEMQDVCGDDWPSKPTIYNWLDRFKEGRESIEDAPRPGRPKVESGKENVERVKEAIEGDSRLTVVDLAETLGISHSTIHRILVETLGLSRLVARWVPKLLTAEQKKTRKDVCKDLHQRYISLPF